MTSTGKKIRPSKHQFPLPQWGCGITQKQTEHRQEQEHMPNINEMKDSKFLKKEDCGQGILVTIKEVTQENVAQEGAPEQLKWCLHVEESDKPMVLNSTNATVIAAVCGSPETENWAGKKIVLYNDPNVMYAGKITGGIRARAPRTQAAAPKSAGQAAQKPLPPVEDQRDDIPF